jgi:hypothetical protein
MCYRPYWFIGVVLCISHPCASVCRAPCWYVFRPVGFIQRETNISMHVGLSNPVEDINEMFLALFLERIQYGSNVGKIGICILYDCCLLQKHHQKILPSLMLA